MSARFIFFNTAVTASALFCAWFVFRFASPTQNVTPGFIALVLLCGLFIAFALSYWFTSPFRRLTRDLTERVGTTTKTTKAGTADSLGGLHEQIDSLATRFEEAEAERRRFIANVSHEFQTPLTVISGYATHLKDISQDDARLQAEAIEREAVRLSDLTRQLLLLAQLDTQSTLTTTEVPVKESIEHALDAFVYPLHERKIAVATDLDETLTIQADPILLTQVWNNLISNAIKATDDGGMIKVRAYADSKATIVVEDAGTGMDETTKRHLFERFYRGKHAHVHPGTGLGLSIVQEIVHLHDGTISVESELGRGTAFVLRFP